MSDQSSNGSGGSIANKPGSAAPPPQGGQVTASGPRVSVDYGEANQALKHLETALDTLNQAIRENQDKLWVRGPGNEQPSGTFATSFNSLAKKELRNLATQRNAIQAMHDNLKSHLASQHATEQANTASMNGVHD